MICKSNVLVGFRIVLGCVFVFSVALKVRSPYDFLSQIYDYELVGANLGVAVAVVLPWLEIVVGSFLLAGVMVGGSLIVSVGFGLVFVLVQASVIYRGLDIACGCFGDFFEMERINYSSMLRSGVLLGIAVVAFVTWFTDIPAITWPAPRLGNS